ncbi:MAG: hypothetical protein ABIL68_02105 [bacterium]
MNKRIILCALMVLLMMAALARAQSENPRTSIYKSSNLGLRPKGFLDNLLDLSKFSMTHSYSISFTSMGRQTFSQGLYLNTMNYQFSDPLRMQVRIGYLHQPLGVFGNSNTMNGQVFVQRAMLQYKPYKNMSITVDYQSIPSRMVSPYYYRW